MHNDKNILDILRHLCGSSCVLLASLGLSAVHAQEPETLADFVEQEEVEYTAESEALDTAEDQLDIELAEEFVDEYEQGALDTDDSVAYDDESYDPDVDDGKSLEEVIVTVDRVEQSLQDYAGTAVSFTGDELKLQGIQDITDLSENVVGLEIGNARGNVEVWIRGVGSSDSTERGDPAAATHVDGIYIPRPRGIGGAFFDLQRVEVNVGPQGTLRGRNAMAGSVNAIPWRPGLGTWDVAIESEFGAYNQRLFQATINAPLGEKLATRLAVLKKEHDPYYNDVSPDNRRGAESADDFASRLQFLYEPTDRLRILVAGDYLTEKGTGYTGTNYANPLGNGIPANSIDDPRDVWARGITPIQDTTHWGAKLQIDYELERGTIELNYGYRDLYYDYQASTPLSPDFPGAADALGGVNIRDSLDDFSRFQDVTDSVSNIVELRYFTSPDDELYFTTGFFYFNEEQYSFLGATGDRGTFFQGIEFNQPDTDTESFAAYVDATWNYTEKTRFTAGLRFTDEHKSRRGVNASYRFNGVGVNSAGGDGSGLGFRVGTQGFEYAIQDRPTVDFNPQVVDLDGNGTIEQVERQIAFSKAYIVFTQQGVKTWGVNDNFDDVLAIRFEQLNFLEDALRNGVSPANGDGATSTLTPAQLAVYESLVPECIDTKQDDSLECPADGRFLAITEFSPFLSIVPQQASVDYSFVDWRFRAEHNFSDDSLLYFLVATGHKSGGFNDTFAVPYADDPTTPGVIDPVQISNPDLATEIRYENAVGDVVQTVDPEKITNYELGTKNEFEIPGMDIGVRLNGSLFYQDYRKQIFCNVTNVESQITGEFETSNSLGVSFCFNTERNEIFGSQLEGAFFFPRELTFKWSALWLESYFRDGPVETLDSRVRRTQSSANLAKVDISGNRLPRSPRYSLNFSLSQTVDLPWGTLDYIASAAWRDEFHMTVFNGNVYDSPDNPENPETAFDDLVEAYWTFDLGAGFSLADTNFRVETFVNNVTNEVRAAALLLTPDDNTRFFTRPRTYGVRLKWQL